MWIFFGLVRVHWKEIEKEAKKENFRTKINVEWHRRRKSGDLLLANFGWMESFANIFESNFKMEKLKEIPLQNSKKNGKNILEAANEFGSRSNEHNLVHKNKQICPKLMMNEGLAKREIDLFDLW
jgi:hypothetical protein